MLTKGKTTRFRAVKCAAMVLALVAVLALCFTGCGKAVATDVEYVVGTLEKGQYVPGDTFSCAGAQIKVTYDDGTSETVAVTESMVGSVVLSAGMSTIEVNYSKDGAVLKCTIPVSVVDPLSNDKAAAIAAINGNDKVANGDKGVAAMVAEYINKVNAAVTKENITKIVNDFETEVAEYVAGKAEALAKVTLTDAELSAKGLYEQFLLDVKHAMEQAKANIKAALSVEQANDLVVAFEATIAEKLNEQKFYEEQGGQIDQKMDLIKLINKYIAKAENYIALIETHNPTNTDAIKSYEDAIAELELLKDEVRLAINLTGYREQIEAVNTNALTTDVDHIYTLIKDGFTITPAPYVNGVLAATDETKELIAEYNEFYAGAVAEFGESMAIELMKEYKYGDSEFEVVDLVALLVDIEAKRDELEEKQEAIAALNSTVAAWTAPTAQQIKDAWIALKTWGVAPIGNYAGANTVMFTSADLACNTLFQYDDITYVTDETKAYPGVYAVNAFTGYLIDEAALTEYYFPALDALRNATKAAEEKLGELGELTTAMAPIVLSHDDNVDAAQRIAAARAAYNAYAGSYAAIGDEIVAVEAAIVAAETRYAQLVAAAANVNSLIAALGEANDIVIEDYFDGGKLKVAYDAYLAFAAFNVDDEGNSYVDVIADVDGDEATTNDKNEAHLVACLDKYVEKKFIEEVEVKGALKIIAAYKDRMDLTDEKTETELRQALTQLKNEQLDKLPTFADYDRTGETIENKIDTVLQDNVDKMVADAIALAQAITDFVYNAQ